MRNIPVIYFDFFLTNIKLPQIKWYIQDVGFKLTVLLKILCASWFEELRKCLLSYRNVFGNYNL